MRICIDNALPHPTQYMALATAQRITAYSSLALNTTFADKCREISALSVTSMDA